MKLHLVDDDGTVLDTWEPDEYDLTKPFAANLFSAEIVDTIVKEQKRIAKSELRAKVARLASKGPGATGLCPVCGETIHIINATTDDRLVGSCQDAFTVEQWEAD